MNFFGSKEKDFVIQTKGRVKINFGDKFIELFNGSKFTTGENFIRTTSSKPSTTDPDGFYFDESTGTLYLKIGDKIYEIFSNAKQEDGYISYKEPQNLTSEEKNQAQENIGISFDTAEDAINSGSEGIVYIKNENKAYLLQGGKLYPIINNTEITIGDKEDNYTFDKTVTIDIGDEGLSLIIEGLKNYIRVGTEDNHTDIYQTSDGGVINSDKSLVIQINDKRIINVTEGKVDFSAVINALKGIITDEIYSSNYEKGDPSIGEGKGWGIWIDKETGESYLQVDNILTKSNNLPVYLTYQEALNLIKEEDIIPSKLYVVIDYQNEWEITPIEDIIGNNFPKEGFDPTQDSLDPSKYDENTISEPIFGLDRNVRPIILEGKSESSFSDEIKYFYREDSQDILDIRYDIKEDNYKIIEDAFNNEKFNISDTLLEFPNKGRIYYMKDSWNNEAPCDFKHFINENKEYIFNSPDNKDLSSLNTSDSIVCSNNKILDISIKNEETLNPIIIKGEKVNNNTLEGSFKEISMGKSSSIIENNYFVGNFYKCIWSGNIQSNIFRVNSVEECTFEKDMIGNQIISSSWKGNNFKDSLSYNIFQSNVTNLTGEGYINNNQFIGRIQNVHFYKDTSNPNYGINNNIINGLFSNCNIYVDFSHNTITGPMENSSFNIGPTDQTNCLFNYNDIKAASINTLVTNGDCRRNNIKAEVLGPATFEGDFESNSLSYFNMRGVTINKMLGCTGEGNSFLGTLDAEFENCEFGDITNCTFRNSSIKFAKFRNNFGGQNFSSNSSIKDLDLLYDSEHQVDVFFHKGKIEVSCQACNSPLKGEIKMFSGLISDIPEGWHICDGTNGTPNLIDKFIKADTKVGESTDDDSMDYPLELNSSNVPVGVHTHTSSTQGEDLNLSGTGTAVFRIPGHTHQLKFVNVSKAKRVETGDGQGAQSYHFGGIGSIFKEGEQWNPATGSGGIVTSSVWDGEDLVSEAREQEISADFDVNVGGSTSGSTDESGDPNSGTDKTLEIKLPRYYSLIFIMKL